MADRRVVITGVGLISSLGIGKEQYFQSLLNGTVGVDRIKSYDPGGLPCQIAGEAPPLKMSRIVPKAQRKSTKLMSRDIELAIAAADDAVRDARLNTRGTNTQGQVDINPTRSGVNIGAGLICCDLVELAAAVEHAVEDGKFSLKKWGEEGMTWLTPLWLLKYLPNMLSCHISIIHDLQGPSNSITCAEASGILAIGEAYRTIVHNRADLMVAGGAENKINPMALIRQSLINRLSTNYNDRPQQAYRPFDRDADGTVLGEGGGIVVLEELEHARKRDAQIYAEITGFGASYNPSRDFVKPQNQGAGIRLAMQKAIRQANLDPHQIQLLIPHGLAVPEHDRIESAAINAVFGDYTRELPILAVKSRIGNCGAGAAAIDLSTAVLALKEGKIPPNLNCPNPPAEYGLNINNEIIDADIEHAISCCFTYGGQTAALVVSKIRK